MPTYSTDVLIIGGGIAGIAAALELIERGREVLLIDRDEEQAFGGLARESFGGLFFVDSREQRRNRIKDSPAQALADWHSFAQFGPDDHLPRAWAERYIERCIPDVYDWLRRHGIKFLPLPLWVERGDEVRGNSVPRFHMVWGTGRELAVKLIAALDRHPNAGRLTRRFGHRVETLVAEAGRVRGCAGVHEADGASFEARAEHVIVATGGINGNIDRVRANWHRDWKRPPEIILNGSHKYADGMLHDAVAAVGGRITHLDNMWNYASGVHHYRPRKPLHGLSLVPPKSALWLDWRGRRIGPQPLVSGFDTRALVTAVCAQERQYSWQVLNWRIALKELAVSGAEFNPAIRDKSILAVLAGIVLGNRWLVRELTENCMDVVMARSLPELALKMNTLQHDHSIDADELTKVVTSYDAAIDAGNRDDPQLRRIAELCAYRGDRLRISKSQKIVDDDAMPLIAIREFIVSRKSLGGIQTDLDGRVMSADGTAIPGLFAAGEGAGFGGGGMHGLRGLEGTFLGGCIFSGRVAGRSIAGSVEV